MTKALKDHKARAHALLSASSAHRWLACPPSAVAADAYPQQDTTFTREGTLAHEVAERIALHQLKPHGGKGTAEELFAELLAINDVTQEMIDCGVGYAGHLQELCTVDKPIIMLEQIVDFSAWVPEAFGTCDCVLIQGDTLTVVDYKYGVGVPVSAVDNPQLRLYALGALNDYGIAFDVQKVEMHMRDYLGYLRREIHTLIMEENDVTLLDLIYKLLAQERAARISQGR